MDALHGGYPHFIINRNDNTFYINNDETICTEGTESTDEFDLILKKQLLAISTLSKINQIVEKKMTYSSPERDRYSELSEEELLESLKEISLNIDTLTSHPKLKKIFQKEQLVVELKKRIIKQITSPLADLPPEVICNILKYLDLSDRVSFSQLNKRIKEIVGNFMLSYTQKIGYKGGDVAEAGKYLNELCKEVKELKRECFIPKNCWAYKEIRNSTLLDVEKTLENLNNLSFKEIFDIFTTTQIYCSSFEKIRNRLIEKIQFASSLENQPLKEIAKVLELSVKHDQKEIVEMLLRLGVDPNTALPSGCYPLHWAAMGGFVDIIKLLIDKGANINQKTSQQNTVLTFACQGITIHGSNDSTTPGERKGPPNASLVKYLLEQGADPNVLDSDGMVPLHWAARGGFSDIIRLLIEYKVPIDARSRKGITALGHACGIHDTTFRGWWSPSYEPNPEVVELLLSHGANPCNVNLGDAQRSAQDILKASLSRHSLTSEHMDRLTAIQTLLISYDFVTI